MKINLLQIGTENLAPSAASSTGTTNGADFVLMLAECMGRNRPSSGVTAGAGDSQSNAAPLIPIPFNNAEFRSITTCSGKINGDQSTTSVQDKSVPLLSEQNGVAVNWTATISRGIEGGQVFIQMTPTGNKTGESTPGSEILVQLTGNTASCNTGNTGNEADDSSETESDDLSGLASGMPVLVLSPDMSDPQQVDAILQMFPSLNISEIISSAIGDTSAIEIPGDGSLAINNAGVSVSTGEYPIPDLTLGNRTETDFLPVWPDTAEDISSNVGVSSDSGEMRTQSLSGEIDVSDITESNIPSEQYEDAIPSDVTVSTDTDIRVLRTTRPIQNSPTIQGSSTTEPDTTLSQEDESTGETPSRTILFDTSPEKTTLKRSGYSASITTPGSIGERKESPQGNVSTFETGSMTGKISEASQTSTDEGQITTSATEVVQGSETVDNQIAKISVTRNVEETDGNQNPVFMKTRPAMNKNNETNRISGIESPTSFSNDKTDSTTVDSPRKTIQSTLYNSATQINTHTSSPDTALPTITVFTPDGEKVEMRVIIQPADSGNKKAVLPSDTFPQIQSKLNVAGDLEISSESSLELQSSKETEAVAISDKPAEILIIPAKTVIMGKIIREPDSSVETNISVAIDTESTEVSSQPLNDDFSMTVTSAEEAANALSDEQGASAVINKTIFADTIPRGEKLIPDVSVSGNNHPYESVNGKIIPDMTLSTKELGAPIEELARIASSETAQDTAEKNNSGQTEQVVTDTVESDSWIESTPIVSNKPSGSGKSEDVSGRLIYKVARFESVQGNLYTENVVLPQNDDQFSSQIDTLSESEKTDNNAEFSLGGNSRTSASAPADHAQASYKSEDGFTSSDSGENVAAKGARHIQVEVNEFMRSTEPEAAPTIQVKPEETPSFSLGNVADTVERNDGDEITARSMNAYMPGTARKIHIISLESARAERSMETEPSGDGNALNTENVSTSPMKNDTTQTAMTSGVRTDWFTENGEQTEVTGRQLTSEVGIPSGEDAVTTKTLISSDEITSTQLTESETIDSSAWANTPVSDTETDFSVPGRGEINRSRMEKQSDAGDSGVKTPPVAEQEMPIEMVAENETVANRISVADADPATDVSLQNTVTVNPDATGINSRKNGDGRRSARIHSSETSEEAMEQVNTDVSSARESRIEKRIHHIEQHNAETNSNGETSSEASSTPVDAASVRQSPASAVNSNAFASELFKTSVSGETVSGLSGVEDIAASTGTIDNTGSLKAAKQNSGLSPSLQHLHTPSEYESGILNSVVRQARFMLQRGQSSATITLEPPSLGKLKLEILTENSKITGKIVVESQEVQNIIRNSISDLHESLSQGGLQVESFDVQVGHNDGTDSWARREDYESITKSLRLGRENAASVPEASVSEGLRGKSITTGIGYIDTWM